MSGFNVEQQRKKQNSIWMDFVRIAVITIGLELLWISFSRSIRIPLQGMTILIGMIPMIFCGYIVASSDSWIAGKVKPKIMNLFRALALLSFFLVMFFIGRGAFVDGCALIYDNYSGLFNTIRLISNLDFIKMDDLELAWVIIPVTFVLSMFYTKIQETRKGFFLLGLIQLSPLFAVMITNHLPEYHYFVGLPVSIILLMVSSFGNRTRVILKKEVMVCIVFGVVFILGEVLVGNLKDYKIEERRQYAKVRVALKNITDVKLEKMLEEIHGNDFSNQGIGKGELSKLDSFQPSDKKVAEITLHAMPEETVYLRSFVASEYSRERWNLANQEVEEELDELLWDETDKESVFSHGGYNMMAIVNICESNLRGKVVNQEKEYNVYGDTMILKPLTDLDGVQLIPYFALLNQDDLVFNQELFPQSDMEGGNISYAYYPKKAAELFTEERINETVVKYYEGGDGNEYRGSEVLLEPDKYWNGYRDFVIDYYEQYPENLDAFNELVNQLRRREDAPDWKGLDAEIDDLIASKFHYTRKPGKTPEGMDFVENFVKTKRGFCVHFATLSTLLYRAMGIPARYVEGYAVPKDAFHTTGMGGRVEGTINNQMAHAWCEVYDGNMGWIPKEHTPGYVEVEKKQVNNKPMKNQVPSTTKTEKETTTAKKVENTTVQSTETVTKKDEKMTVVSGKTETKKSVVPVFVFFGVLGAVGAVYVQYFVRRRNKEKKFKMKKDNIGMRYMIQELFQICGAVGIDLKHCSDREAFLRMKENIPALEEQQWSWIYDRGLVAAFSKEIIPKEEYREMKKMLNRLKQQIWKEMNPFRKILIKLVYAL
ncbi:MAG: transglutaminase-like domain-containing protein [Eubacterium sp.]|nr:transglutaminase-like domain-containing protein [Eubacterium sp.]